MAAGRKGETPLRQGLVPDSEAMKPEPQMQQRFSLGALAGMAAILGIVVAAHALLLTLPDRAELGPRATQIQFEPIRFDSDDFGPMRLLGAWKLKSADRRVGGLSSLAFDHGTLVALSDSGVIVRFPKPGGPTGPAVVQELPGGPGNPRQKINRDSEAMVRDPTGRGWWVAFETRAELWLYNSTFTRALRRVTIPPGGLQLNRGVEGLASSGADLLLLPENGGRLLWLANDRWSEVRFDFAAKRSSGMARLPDGSLLVLERRLSGFGIVNSIVRLKPCSSGYCLDWRKRLPVGIIDNVEGIAVEPRGGGTNRLWLVTDDDSAPPRRTLLIELELPPQR